MLFLENMLIPLPELSDPLELLLQLIFQRFLTNTYCFTVITENQLNLQLLTTNTQNVKLNMPIFSAMLTATDNGCTDYIIQMKTPDDFIKMYGEVNKASEIRRGERKIIFAPTSSDNSKQMLDLLKLNEISQIPNVLLIIPIQPIQPIQHCQAYELVTHTFVGDGARVREPKTLATWDSCELQLQDDTNLFPHDLKNLHGKTIKVACFTYKPFTVLDLDASVVPNGRDGIDMKTIDEFCKWINCTVEIVREDAIAWGPMDGTGGGVIGDTAHGIADLGTTSLGMWYGPHKLMDYSVYGMQAAVTALAPEPRMISRWELPLIAIDAAIWVFWFVALFLASAVLWLAQRSNEKVLLTSYGILIAQPQRLPPSWRMRSVAAWLAIAGFVINVAYCSGLAALFTIPVYQGSIDTIDDLTKSGMTWGASHDAWVYSIMETDNPKIRQVIEQFRAYPPEVLTVMSLNRSIAFGIEVLPSGYSAIGDYLTAPAVVHYRTMVEDFYYEHSVVMARKNSPYVGRVSEIVLRLHETGLMLAWDTQMVMKYLDYDVQLAVYFSRVTEPIETAPLSFKHVMGIFFILAFGILVASAVFALEILNVRRQEKRVQ